MSNGGVLPKTPAKRTREEPFLCPASVGKESPAHTADPMKASRYLALDSAVDWMADGKKIPSLYVSANSFAFKLVQNLETIVKAETIETKYTQASDAYRKDLEFMRRKLLHAGLGINERYYFTGIFCQALNSVLKDGMIVNHLECIGEGTTHSDLSGRYFRGGQAKPILLVGEGRSGEDGTIRTNVRGQVANEFIRHRNIDAIRGIRDFAPVLLLGLNYANISLELAFPSIKGGTMEKNEWVVFKENVQEGTEVFWTIPIAFVHLVGDSERAQAGFKLPRLFKFISNVLWELKTLKDSQTPTSRVQFKSPWLTHPEWFSTTDAVRSGKRGDNVTILSANNKTYVYKEFCYYLRYEDGFNRLDESEMVRPDDQRKPPAKELLETLGEPYQSWTVLDGPFGIKILSYEYLEGDNRPQTKDAWIQVLMQIQKMHSIGWVHGDLLPRNVIFNGQNGHVIDFDLSRKENGVYVGGYEYLAFKEYRHSQAQSKRPMEKKHDVWSLVKLSEEYFVLPNGWVNIDRTEEVAPLIQWFSTNNPGLKDGGPGWTSGEATGSPTQ